MHPTGAAALPAGQELEPHALHSMDWLFKKERIYLLAQFWQQRATLAEKEVTNLKEQLAVNPSQTGESYPPSTKSLGSHDGTSPPPSSQQPTTNNNNLQSNLSHDSAISPLSRDDAETPDLRKCPSADDLEHLIDSPSKMELAAQRGNCNDVNSIGNNIAAGGTTEVELAAKEKEICQLGEDLQRLRASFSALREAHSQQLRRLEQRLDDKRRHIARLEARLDCQRDYEDIKREVSILRSVDISAASENKQFQQMLIERSKALSQTDSLPPQHPAALIQPPLSQPPPSLPPPPSPAPLRELDTSREESVEREQLHPTLQSHCDRRNSAGKEGGMPPFGRSDSADMNEERIAHILSEASQMMRTPAPNEDSRSNDDSKSPHGQCLSPFSNKESSQNRRLKKYENDDIPQEKVVRIYQEELAKLMGRRMEDMRQPREGFPGFFFPQYLSGGGPPHMERPPDDNIRMALEAYHRELAKLQQQGAPIGQVPGLPPGIPPGLPPNLPPGFPGLLALQHQHQNPHLNGSGVGVQDLSLPKEKMMKMNGITDAEKEKAMDAEEAIRHAGSAFSLVRPKLEPGSQPSTGSSASSPLGNNILPPAITPGEEFSGAAAASPLQRMASITNSLISQPTNQSHHSPSQRPLKAVLPPITQQQFDLFNNLNTEDIVRRVKESLSQYSISQRLFGESVLGLSQGSVSDLLARPKPWHMLTQKGREPFIRMKMFLEDDNAVHKLVASQYKIAPEKLMRTGSYGGIPQNPANLSKPMQPTQKMISDASQLLSKMQQEQHAMMNSGMGGPPPLLLTPPGFPPHPALQLRPDLTHEQHKVGKPPPPPAIHHSPMQPHQGSVMRALHQHISPSVYEMAALTQDLDTQTITTKIKEALLANNIGQKIFGEAVLGLSQGSVSELLSKPKPWHMLSIKGREPFIRMQLWLSDPHNIDRLQALKNERREANKRRRSTGPGGQDNSSDTSSNDTAEFYHSTSPSPHPGGAPSAKKQRVLFSEEQKEALRLAFALDPYPNMATIEFLATELGLSTRTITNWFHNHRMRLKQQVPHGGAGDIPARDQSGNQAPFDPVQFRLLLNQRLLELQKERLGLAGVPLPYPPYFAANSNLAALLGRGLLPPGDAELALTAVKEQISGLDLSMPLKREPDGDDFDDDDVESNIGSEDSMDERSFVEGDPDGDGEGKTDSTPRAAPQGGARSSRRKPAAPQWVNPEWQDDKERPPNPDEVIINGVCVMQTEDYGRRAAERTVRIEPAGADAEAEANPDNAAPPRAPTPVSPVRAPSPPPVAKTPHDLPLDIVKSEVDADRWEY